MARPFDFGKVNLSAGGDESFATPQSETPFCVALLGDFTGRGGRGICEPGSIATRRQTLIDRDNFDEVLASFSPEIRLQLGEADKAVALRFSELDEFHPDRLFARVPQFQTLQAIRARLQDPASFAAAIKELGLASGGPAPEQPRENEPSLAAAASAQSIAKGNLLDQTIEQTEIRVPDGRRRAPDELQDFVRRVTEPHLIAAADPRRGEVVEAIDRAISAQMRAVLRAPDFQALEAVWRAVFLLVRRLETSSQLKLYLIDISREELAADLESAADLHETAIYRRLVEKSVGTPGAEPWTVVAGNYVFGPERKDAELLGRMARVAAAAGAPFLAGASPRFLGCASLAVTPESRDWKPPQDADTWAALRRSPEARAVGLALPRFLLRLPYGKRTDPIESFAFEEMPDTPSHENYLWGNPAFLCALLLAQTFGEYGWDLRPGVISELDGMPLHVYEQSGESALKPCAEVLLTESAAEQILESGLMPLLSLKGKDRVRLMRFQSIAEPLQALAGRWKR
ncbi:MAG: type VI secretion system contractile sheath large subunit [Terriglobales bacterium]